MELQSWFPIYYCEANLAIVNGYVVTNWSGNWLGVPGTLGTAGQYTLDGTPTGVSWPYSTPPVGTTEHNFIDGTSDGTNIYTVETIAVSNDGNPLRQVIAHDLQWQNPTVLFDLPGSDNWYSGITYNPVDNAFWISKWLGSTVSRYSLTGTLLDSFTTEARGTAALAYDPADDTLWLTTEHLGYLLQYSKTGALLQSGVPVGLPRCCYQAGEIASTSVPEPASLALLGSGLAGLLSPSADTTACRPESAAIIGS